MEVPDGRPKKGLAKGARVSVGAARQGLRRLFSQGVLRLIERSKSGYVIEVRLPGEILAGGSQQIKPEDSAPLPSADSFEKADFLRTKSLR